MGIKDGETIYKLQRSFKYSLGRETKDASYLTLYEVGSEHFSEFLKLEQMATRAQISLVKYFDKFKAEDIEEQVSIVEEKAKTIREHSDEIEKDLESADKDIAQILKMSDEVDTFEIVKTFKKMVLKQNHKVICVVDGIDSVPMTSALWEKMHPTDMLNVACKYISFFVMPEGKTTHKDSNGVHKLSSQAKVV